MKPNRTLPTAMLLASLAGSTAACAAGDELGETADAITRPNFAFDALQFTESQFARTTAVATTATDNFTLEAWVRWDGGTTGRVIFYNGNSSTSGYGLYAEIGGVVRVLLGGVGWVDCTTCRLSPGIWTHLAVERQLGLWTFFQDGGAHPATSTSQTLAPHPPTGQLSIGAAPSGDPSFTASFNGAIDEVRVWNTPLPPAAIQQDRTAALMGNENGLVAYYRLDEGNGATSVDASPGNHPLTLQNSPIWISSGATLSTGIARNAIQLTGAAYAHASTVVTTRTDDVTLEGWVRWDGGTAAQAMLYNGDSSTSGYGIYLINGGVAILSGGIGWASCTTCSLTPGAWTYLAAVRSGGQWSIYQDGTARNVSNAALPSATPSGVFSIASSPSGGERLIGAIDEVRVWAIARTQQQITSDYGVSLSSTEPDLIAYYRIDEGTGSVTADAVGNHPITLYNAPTWTTSGALLATAER